MCPVGWCYKQRGHSGDGCDCALTLCKSYNYNNNVTRNVMCYISVGPFIFHLNFI